MKGKSRTSRENIARYDEWIQKGEAAKVRGELRLIARDKPPREDLALLANIARRAGLPTLGVRLLQPVFKSELEHGLNMTPRERASYAASLAAIGAQEEAFSLLKVLADDATPEVQLYLSFICMYRWDYRTAIEHLERYLKLGGLSEYQVFVAKVNLAGALSFEGETAQLLALTDELIETGLENHWNLLTRDCWLLATHGRIQMQDWERAGEALENAAQLSSRFGLNPLLVRKWRALLDFSARPKDATARAKLAEFKNESVLSRDFESARDCDYHLGVIAQDHSLLQKVYFGTPFPSYRRRIEQRTRDWFTLPAAYTWALQGRHGPLLDLSTGHTPWEQVSGTVLNVLRALTRDIYRPMRLAALFANLYPGEHFDPVSSPLRVRKAVHRTREWIEEHGADLRIHCERNLYSLRTEQPLDVRVSLNYGAATPPTGDGARVLKAAFPYKAFSTQQAAQALSVSVPAARTILKNAVAGGVILQIGNRRSTLFRFGK